MSVSLFGQDPYQPRRSMRWTATRKDNMYETMGMTFPLQGVGSALLEVIRTRFLDDKCSNIPWQPTYSPLANKFLRNMAAPLSKETNPCKRAPTFIRTSM